MCMVAGPDKLLKAEPQRITAQAWRRPTRSAASNTHVGAASACRRKLALRQIEGIDFLPRGVTPN